MQDSGFPMKDSKASLASSSFFNRMSSSTLLMEHMVLSVIVGESFQFISLKFIILSIS